MPKGMRPIYRRVLASDTTSITFNNIPQTFTDLKLLVRGRTTGGNVGTVFANINTGTSNTGVTMYGETTGQGAFGITSGQIGYITGVGVDLNGVGSCETYIPNYRSNGLKVMVSNSVTEANSTAYQSGVQAQVLSTILSLSAITSINISTDSTGFQAGTSFTLYGIGA